MYHFFRDYAVTVDHGIDVPAWLEASIHSPLSVYLTGDRGGPGYGWPSSKLPSLRVLGSGEFVFCLPRVQRTGKLKLLNQIGNRIRSNRLRAL